MIKHIYRSVSNGTKDSQLQNGAVGVTKIITTSNSLSTGGEALRTESYALDRKKLSSRNGWMVCVWSDGQKHGRLFGRTRASCTTLGLREQNGAAGS